MTKQQLDNLIAKAKLCNRLDEITVRDKMMNSTTTIYIIHKSEDEVVVSISDETWNTDMIELADKGGIAKYIRNNPKLVKVVGGKEISDAHNLFHGIECKTLDLTEFNTASIVDATSMFEECSVKVLNLGNDNKTLFKMPALRFSNRMFANCWMFKIVGINNVNNKDMLNTDDMFIKFHGNELDLSSFERRVGLSDLAFSSVKNIILNHRVLNDYGEEDIINKLHEHHISYTTVNYK